MDAIKLLKAQHREVEKLFRRYEAIGDENASEKRRVFEEVADLLAAHATIEERHFYPTAKYEETEELLREALEEHLSVKRIIADLLELAPTDPTFDAKMTALKEQVEHHVEEEEEALMPKVQKLFTKEELDAMGELLESTFQELMQEEPRTQVPTETDVAPPLS
jgi:hypothetical protein